MHSVKGSAVEAVRAPLPFFLFFFRLSVVQIGNLTGSKSWQDAGKEEHAEGEAETKAAQAKGYAEGMKDRVVGVKDDVVGAMTGDDVQQTSGWLPFFCFPDWRFRC